MIRDIGEFVVESGLLRATDPCYKRDATGAEVIPNVRRGTWKAFYDTDKTWWGKRVLSLTVMHEALAATEDYPYELQKEGWKQIEESLGVDSGQFGFFDDSKYPVLPEEFEYDNHKGFYFTVCNATHNETAKGDEDYFTGGIIGDFGVSSSTGFGDGSYKVFTKTVEGLVVGATVIFIWQQDKR